MNQYTFPAFSGYGIEIEYMIVDRDTLNVRPIADRLLVGAEDMDLPRGEAAWSNELALHVIETKTAGPASDLTQAAKVFRREVNAIEQLLSEHNAQLMPTGMHPWMDPFTETQLWPHQNNEIYSSFDRIFGCQGHGWSNLQSMHINFPFKDEVEFGKLHAACRFVLALLPALSSSTPFWDGKRAPHLDQRLAVYKNNCAKIPSVSGQIIPEPIYSYAGYHELLAGIYADIAPYDPDEILQEEWLNARGAIARFDRGAIEIRVLDTQECPEQDLALAFFTTELVKAIYFEEFGDLGEVSTLPTTHLTDLFLETVRCGRSASVNEAYAKAVASQATSMGALLSDLVSRLVPVQSTHYAALQLILEQGSLAERILQAVPEERPSRDTLFAAYKQLCSCLRTGQPYLPR